VVDEGYNLDDDPLFVDPNGADGLVGTEDDDLRLMQDSPAIDMGDNNSLPDDALDLDGDGDRGERVPIDLSANVRVFDGGGGMAVVDLGAYEFGSVPVGLDPAPWVGRTHVEVKGLEIYPNPVGETLNIELKEETRGPVTILLFDVLGRVVSRTLSGTTGSESHFLISELPPASGTYFVCLQDVMNGRRVCKAVLIQ